MENEEAQTLPYDDMSDQAKYYRNNKEKVLAYKKMFYAQKTLKYNNVRSITIKGISKLSSNKILKKAIDIDRLKICVYNQKNELTTTTYNNLNDYQFPLPIFAMAEYENIKHPVIKIPCEQLTKPDLEAFSESDEHYLILKIWNYSN